MTSLLKVFDVAQCQGAGTRLGDECRRTLHALVQGEGDVGRHIDAHLAADVEGLVGDDGLADAERGAVVDGDLLLDIAQSAIGDARVVGQCVDGHRTAVDGGGTRAVLVVDSHLGLAVLGDDGTAHDAVARQV